MLAFEDLKAWYRSGSLNYARYRRQTVTGPLNWADFYWHGNRIFFRPGTSDTRIIDTVLLKPENRREYLFPKSFTPQGVLDIGANIGITSVLLSHLYPAAKIYSFEPQPENFALLEQNTRNLRNISAFPVGLADTDGALRLYSSDDPKNHGGASLFDKGVDLSTSIEVPLRDVEAFLTEEQVAPIDLIKIDAEGAEYSILTRMAPERLSRVKWIFGELHGQKDFELLAYLSQWFDISIRKGLESRISTFEAKNKTGAH